MFALRSSLLFLSCLTVFLGGCVVAPQPVPAPSGPSPEYRISAAEQAQADRAVERFVSVAQRMEPQIRNECSVRTRLRNCAFRIVVDDRIEEPPNAFQLSDRSGRPVIGVTLSMIADVRNTDELAFVLAHEAAHYIAGHLAARERDALRGAALLGGIARAQGGDSRAVADARQIGAEIGARVYSKDYELEADRLGTIITWDAGYDPLKGAEYFRRIPDPGDKILGTHPANRLRIDVVRKTVASLRAGGDG